MVTVWLSHAISVALTPPNILILPLLNKGVGHPAGCGPAHLLSPLHLPPAGCREKGLSRARRM